VNALEALIFPEQLLWQHQFKYQILRVKLLAIDLQLAKIYELIFQLVFVFMVLLAHLDVL